MEKLPVLSLPRTRLEQLHDILSVVVLAFSIIYFILNWSDLPQTVPIHYNGRGEADGWGSKATLLILPLLSLILFIGLSILSKYPHKFNYPFKINAENAPHQYQTAKLLLSWMKVELVLLFGYLQWSIIQNALGHSAGIGVWLLPAVLVIIFGTIIIHLIRMKR
ncbi:DUF1648 domain-containing protein [Paenibacillus oenotherae]|uniref:DUF1648 domain-containing protein n=1 Tax=Paenibacillus oenotherae TaxID=1435645 RepID=A0ABS7D6P3_9BACL|nr:DUF1648 domain-containing protein [Paenibacillus oenotherae]MBW7475453.1 DUF1648 domain-containing protein [Paenibacillus oenotherae]